MLIKWDLDPKRCIQEADETIWRNVEKSLTESNSKHRKSIFTLQEDIKFVYNYTTDDQNILDGQYLEKNFIITKTR